MPRVLYIIGQLRRGGAEQQLFYLLKYWPHSATVLVLENNPSEAYWAQPIRELGYPVIEITRHSHYDVKRLVKIVHLLRILRPDIVHLFTDAPAGVYGRIAALLIRHPCVIVNERHQPSDHPAWFLQLKRHWLNRYVAAVVTNARSSQNFIVSDLNIPAQKAHYIPNGLDLKPFANAAIDDHSIALPDGWENNKIIIGTVGSLRHQKAPEVWLKVARRVIDIYPEVRFLHIGKGPLLEAAKAFRDTLGLTDQVHFMGEQFNIPELMRVMNIFTMTSRTEGMPNAIMEAMAARLPCVVTDAGDSCELVQAGETGFVVPVDDEVELANRIVQLIADPLMRQTMGEKGQKIIQNFSVHVMVERYRELYCKLLTQSSLGKSG